MFQMDNSASGSTTSAFSDLFFYIYDGADLTTQIRFDVVGTVGTSTTIQSSQTANRVLTMPDATDTFAVLALAQTLTNKTIALSGGGNIFSGFTAGSIPYHNGTTLVENNANLFWDNAQTFMGISQNVPLYKLHIKDAASPAPNGTAYIMLESNNGIAGDVFGIGWINTGFAGSSRIVSELNAGGASANLHLQTGGAAPTTVIFMNNVGDVGFSTTSPTTTIDVNGDARIRALGLGIVHSDATGVLTSSAVLLTSEVSGVLPEANGGTNQSTYTTGDILYASAANTLSKLGIGAAGRFLQVVGGIPAWSAVLAEANGGTNQSTYATGDLIYASAANTLSKRAIGSANDVLTVVAGVPTWQAPAAGGGTDPLITTYTSGSGNHTITGSPLYMKVTVVGGGGAGAGGAGGGSNGGNSTFDNLTGALGSGSNTGANNGSGGTGTVGAGWSGYTVTGGNGGRGSTAGSGDGGMGGGSLLGFGGSSASSDPASSGGTATGYGGGGGGFANSGTSTTGGGGGGGGAAIGYDFSPSGSYAYSVGAGGGGGASGGNGAGGAGSAGVIIVEEFYQ